MLVVDLRLKFEMTEAVKKLNTAIIPLELYKYSGTNGAATNRADF